MLAPSTDVGISAAFTDSAMGKIPNGKDTAAMEHALGGAASDTKKSISFCEPVKKMSKGLLKTFKREINASSIYQKTVNGKSYVCFVHDKPEKQHSTVDKIVDSIDKRLQRGPGGILGKTNFISLSDKFSGKVHTLERGDHSVDFLFNQFFDPKTSGKSIGRRHNLRPGVLEYKEADEELVALAREAEDIEVQERVAAEDPEAFGNGSVSSHICTKHQVQPMETENLETNAEQEQRLLEEASKIADGRASVTSEADDELGRRLIAEADEIDAAGARQYEADQMAKSNAVKHSAKAIAACVANAATNAARRLTAANSTASGLVSRSQINAMCTDELAVEKFARALAVDKAAATKAANATMAPVATTKAANATMASIAATKASIAATKADNAKMAEELAIDKASVAATKADNAKMAEELAIDKAAVLRVSEELAAGKTALAAEKKTNTKTTEWLFARRDEMTAMAADYNARRLKYVTLHAANSKMVIALDAAVHIEDARCATIASDNANITAKRAENDIADGQLTTDRALLGVETTRLTTDRALLEAANTKLAADRAEHDITNGQLTTDRALLEAANTKLAADRARLEAFKLDNTKEAEEIEVANANLVTANAAFAVERARINQFDVNLLHNCIAMAQFEAERKEAEKVETKAAGKATREFNARKTARINLTLEQERIVGHYAAQETELAVQRAKCVVRDGTLAEFQKLNAEHRMNVEQIAERKVTIATQCTITKDLGKKIAAIKAILEGYRKVDEEQAVAIAAFEDNRQAKTDAHVALLKELQEKQEGYKQLDADRKAEIDTFETKIEELRLKRLEQGETDHKAKIEGYETKIEELRVEEERLELAVAECKTKAQNVATKSEELRTEEERLERAVAECKTSADAIESKLEKHLAEIANGINAKANAVNGKIKETLNAMVRVEQLEAAMGAAGDGNNGGDGNNAGDGNNGGGGNDGEAAEGDGDGAAGGNDDDGSDDAGEEDRKRKRKDEPRHKAKRARRDAVMPVADFVDFVKSEAASRDAERLRSDASRDVLIAAVCNQRHG